MEFLTLELKSVWHKKEHQRQRQKLIYYWRWDTKAWGANKIRDLSSPCSQRWIFGIVILIMPVLTLKYSAWELRSQDWNLKKLTEISYNRWSMWFNLIYRKESYQFLFIMLCKDFYFCKNQIIYCIYRVIQFLIT